VAHPQALTYSNFDFPTSPEFLYFVRLQTTIVSSFIMPIDEVSSTDASLDGKTHETHEKDAVEIASTPSNGSDTQGFDEKQTKKLLRKLDIHLVPFLALLYL
jgi:hypothetical protein